MINELQRLILIITGGLWLVLWRQFSSILPNLIFLIFRTTCNIWLIIWWNFSRLEQIKIQECSLILRIVQQRSNKSQSSTNIPQWYIILPYLRIKLDIFAIFIWIHEVRFMGFIISSRFYVLSVIAQTYFVIPFWCPYFLSHLSYP